MLWRMKPIVAEPTVLLAMGLVSSYVHLTKGRAKPWAEEPRQKLFLMDT
jgi:hypothetical protein